MLAAAAATPIVLAAATRIVRGRDAGDHTQIVRGRSVPAVPPRHESAPHLGGDPWRRRDDEPGRGVAEILPRSNVVHRVCGRDPRNIRVAPRGAAATRPLGH